MLDRLEGGDHAPELFARAGVGDGLIEHGLGRTQGIGGVHHAAMGDQCLGDACITAAGQALGADLIEQQLADPSRAIDAEQGATGEPGRIVCNQEQLPIARRDQIPIGFVVEHEQRAAA